MLYAGELVHVYNGRTLRIESGLLIFKWDDGGLSEIRRPDEGQKILNGRH